MIINKYHIIHRAFISLQKLTG